MLRAHGDIARARGMAQIAKDTGLDRESLYKALAPGAKPRFDTILKVARLASSSPHRWRRRRPVPLAASRLLQDPQGLEKKGDEQAPASPVAIQVGVDGLEPQVHEARPHERRELVLRADVSLEIPEEAVHVLRRRRNVRGETRPRPAFPVLCPPDFRRAAEIASVPPVAIRASRHSSSPKAGDLPRGPTIRWTSAARRGSMDADAAPKGGEEAPWGPRDARSSG